MDAASLVALRVMVGVLVSVSAGRYWAKGWIDSLLLAPRFHFPYPGFEWVPIPGRLGCHLLFAAVFVAGLALASGRATRASAAVAFACFTWLELIDLSYYLNHYYFLSCLLLTFALAPPDADADGRAPRTTLDVVRVQVAVVYVFAGVAKIGGDWLLAGQPLTIWFGRHADWVVLSLPVGGWLADPRVALLASWAGMVFDLCVVPALCWAPTRAVAYLALLAFHGLTGWLFPIGLFPLVMIAAATVFFEPDWPRRWWPARASTPDDAARPAPPHPLATWAHRLAWLSLAAQALLPLRHWLYPGPVNWTEEGGRFAYRVMLVEKGGAVDFRVVDRRSGARWRVDPSEELTVLQAKMMSTQPDMIACYARHLAARLEHERPGAELAVYADAFVALNGRPRARLIDPDFDLTQTQPGLALRPAPWILPAPEFAP
ncbi:vitamin K-dependent gamma-carboxylase-related protein [Plesiocystis pacifica SIR-1]|uniref:Vitamin K-dependent gamma-carboxylase-related protein n=1 Tax=Plesiocystis pacifica SIR-1 TaxID=391625 RepID=A6G9H3_9BACT|nr:HTTM domain-containing protein [Plesiocystis pacifica]EDM77481.1 vitamin K-dependent gamma-carboxylase-related protein [Plesiocystis pacifica SIR-1]